MGRHGPRQGDSWAGGFSAISGIYTVLGAKAGKRTGDPTGKGLECGGPRSVKTTRNSVRKSPSGPGKRAG